MVALLLLGCLATPEPPRADPPPRAIWLDVGRLSISVAWDNVTITGTRRDVAAFLVLYQDALDPRWEERQDAERIWNDIVRNGGEVTLWIHTAAQWRAYEQARRYRHRRWTWEDDYVGIVGKTPRFPTQTWRKMR